MAFVFKSNRPENMNHTSYDIGPGQYISQKPFLTTSKQLSKPFMSGTNRDNFAFKQETPGPGTYHHDSNLDFMAKLLNSSQEKKREPFYRSLDYENSLTEPYNYALKDDKNDNLGFMSRDKRFKYNKKDIDIPGPGSYLSDIQAQFKQTKMEMMRKTKGQSQKQFHKTGMNSPGKVVSIPAKNQCYGYEISMDNSVLMNLDPEKNKKHTGLKNDIIGPGQYDLSSIKDWICNNKGTSWGKSRTNKTDFTASRLNKSDDLIASINERNYKKNEEAKDRRMKNKELMFKQIKLKNELRKQTTEEIKQKNNNFEKVMMKETPGPGYYFESTDNTAFQTSYVPENYQTFGSTSTRFPPNSILNETVGPGSYFITNKTVHGGKLRSKTFNAPFNSKAKRDSNFKENANFPGPGRYNPDKFISHKADSKNAIFGSSLRRFSEAKKIKEISPGPGSYLQMDEWLKDDSNEFLRKVIPQKPRVDVKVEVEKDKDIFPPVGAYNPDMQFNLGYKVAKKITKFSMVNAPFNSMKRRFEDEKPTISNNLVGPGYYYKTKQPLKEQIYPQFYSSAKRFTDKRVENDVGPGLYNQSSHFDWHKKTYNVSFL